MSLGGSPRTGGDKDPTARHHRGLKARCSWRSLEKLATLPAKSLEPPGTRGPWAARSGAGLGALGGRGCSWRSLSAQGSVLARAPGWREEHRDQYLQGLPAVGRSTGIYPCKGSWDSQKVAGCSSSLRHQLSEHWSSVTQSKEARKSQGGVYLRNQSGNTRVCVALGAAAGRG